MRLLALFGICSVVVSCGLCNDLVNNLLHGVVDKTVDSLKDKLQEVLQQELSNLLNLGGAFGKRDLLSSVLDASSLVNHEGENVKNVLHSYVNTLHDLYNNVHHLDTNTFLHQLENAVAKHGGLLDGVVQQFNKGLAHVAVTNNKRDLAGLFGGLAQQFTSAVQGLKQTLTGSSGAQGGTSTDTDAGGSLLTAVTSHLEHLGQTLSNLKETGAGLLATGQETVDALKNSAAHLLHQTVGGAQGQASQVVDALLHPATK